MNSMNSMWKRLKALTWCNKEEIAATPSSSLPIDIEDETHPLYPFYKKGYVLGHGNTFEFELYGWKEPIASRLHRWVRQKTWTKEQLEAFLKGVNNGAEEGRCEL